MENASKALLMAAGVLIGILILSLAVYLFVSFGATSAEVHKQNEQNQIGQFNAQFTQYIGKDDITIYDVVTVANLATESNISYEYTKRNTRQEGRDNYITVIYKNQRIEYGIEMTTNEITKRYNELIQNDLSEIKFQNEQLKQYTCQAKISNITRKSLSN